MAYIPGSLETQTRTPLDGKYWVNASDMTTLDAGLVFNGLQRFDKVSNKLWIRIANTWRELLTTANYPAFNLSIGNITTGSANVTNSGTGTNPILNFVIPQGEKGDAATIDIGQVEEGEFPAVSNVGTTSQAILNFVLPRGDSLWIAYAYDNVGTGASFNGSNRKYISIIQSRTQPQLTDFTQWRLFNATNGQSLWIAYSPYSNGNNASYTLNTQHKFISILQAETKPPLSEFDTWVLFKGMDGGPAGLSAYQSWLNLGNSGTETDFINSLEGTNGESAYEIWLGLGNTGSEQDFIDSLSQPVDDSNYAKLDQPNIFTESQTISGNTSNIYITSNSLLLDNGNSTNLALSNRTTIEEASNSITVQVNTGNSRILSSDNTGSNQMQLTFTPSIRTIKADNVLHFKVPTPTDNNDAATKAYVDNNSGNGGNGVTIRTGNSLVLDTNAEYAPITSGGTFSVTTTGAVVGSVVCITLGVNATIPTLNSSFIIPPSGGSYISGKEHRIMFNVMYDLRVLTTITPLS